MNKHKKIILSGSILLIILLCLAGVYIFFRVNGTKVFSTAELQSISASRSILIADDTPASSYWKPSNPKSTLSDIITWLKNSSPYRESIPKSPAATFAGNIFPSTLFINTSNNHRITIQPVTYITLYVNQCTVHDITDVLLLNNDGKISYFKSKELYEWLKNDKWQAEFERDSS